MPRQPVMKYMTRKQLNADQVKVKGAARQPRCMTPMKDAYVMSVLAHLRMNEGRLGLASTSEKSTFFTGLMPSHVPFAAAAAALFTLAQISLACSTPPSTILLHARWP